ncbi:FAD-dependent monooxygenase [Amycolatopsis minnesotensis]|uniref:Bifunctional salicylyl-CoA 5-hydroxylase/oxidoreductase n=1 Tax=Amycolatopsis minnesotensis TaxID=337894 RepID=A0ABN2QMY7_9PSEU
MKATVLGAGPAGLYFAILLKKADPTHEVTVIERNAPDATFGWGVVFSEETLGALRDADYESYVEITDTFARWDAIDITYRGRLIRSRGHAFSAIARKQLLRILQERCTRLGVELRFGEEVSDFESLDGDLLVAADGVNSAVRRSRPEVFGSSVRPQGCKYIWFGTDLVFDAFRFIFAQTEHGMLQVHGYPFDENLSTFIVECPEETWRKAGLDTASEAESIAFCEELFAEQLHGHRLFSNRSQWLDFSRVRNRSWHDGRIVLLGDAAHTAHFTIGSGTKLAMEDSIALATAFSRHGDTESALVEYERARQPIVDKFQQAAADSADYFTRVGHHAHLEPLQFAVNLLTRSGRIGYTKLGVRDPDLTRVVDARFAGGPGARFGPPPMLAPLTLGKTVLPNRIVDADGAGLVLSEFVAVSPSGRITPGTPVGIEKPPTDALAGIRLGHSGPRGATRSPEHGVDIALPPGEQWPLLAASSVPYGPMSPAPKAMDADDFARVREEFAAAAARAAEAGFDLLELDCAHGRLLASFLSPLTNRREDPYGDDRLRFPLEVVRAVRAQWPGERPLAVRLTVTDWARRGLTLDDGIVAAKAMHEAGVDLIHVAAGQGVAETRPEYRRGFLTAISDRVRNEARVPTLVGGHLTTLDEVNTVLAAGRADLCLPVLASSPLEAV